MIHQYGIQALAFWEEILITTTCTLLRLQKWQHAAFHVVANTKIQYNFVDMYLKWAIIDHLVLSSTCSKKFTAFLLFVVLWLFYICSVLCIISNILFLKGHKWSKIFCDWSICKELYVLTFKLFIVWWRYWLKFYKKHFTYLGILPLSTTVHLVSMRTRCFHYFRKTRSSSHNFFDVKTLFKNVTLQILNINLVS